VRETPLPRDVFDVDTRTEGDHTVVRLSGELDVYSAFRLRDALMRLDGKLRIAVEMAELEFMDSTGLGVLVGGLKRAMAAGGGLCMVAPQERVLKTFKITGLTRVIPAFPNLREALSYLDSLR
jgi:anti-sigma B factor antagonist